MESLTNRAARLRKPATAAAFDVDRAKVMTKASQWLKVLIVNTGLPVVVCGMPEAEYDHQIGHRNRDSLLPQLSLGLAKLLGTRRIEVQHGDLLQQIRDQTQQPKRIGVLAGPGIEFGQDDAGNRDPARILEEVVSQATGTAHVSGTDVRVQKVRQSSPI